MRIETYSDGASSHPASYDSEYSAYSVSNLTNAYTDSTSTSYAQINLTRNANAVTQIYYNFGSLGIPSNATINSVSCSCKCSINTTTSSRVSTRQAQLYSGNTTMGTASNVANSTTVFNMSCGTWTAAQLENAKIRLYAVRGTSSTTSNYYFRFYGATLTVSYTYNETIYTVTCTSTVPNVHVDNTTDHTKTYELHEGQDIKFLLYGDMTGAVVTDNDVDITSSITPIDTDMKRIELTNV